ncbi:hypothetical protein HN51_046202 [Arachis hypogaea]
MVQDLKEKNSTILYSCCFFSGMSCCKGIKPVLPSDLIKGTLEAKIPYISAFVEIERCLGRPSSACPISSGVMFKPQRVLTVLKLETFAASIAQFIGLSYLL